MTEQSFVFEIDNTAVDERLDQYLANNAELDISRAYIQDLIKSENIKVNAKKSKASYKLREGDQVSALIPEPTVLDIKAENIPLDIIYEDDELMLINKPINMVTHPAQGISSGTLVNAVMHHCKNDDGSFALSAINGVTRPGIVHRLDKDTSGLILVAKTDKAHQSLAQQIQERSLERRYLALVHSNIKTNSGTIKKNIGRHPKHRHKMAVTDGSGRTAITNWFVKKRFDLSDKYGMGSKKQNQYCLVECKLETGRTHQIRVHMSWFRHPIVGDLTYGPEKARYSFKVSRPLLHSYKIAFDHPKTAERLDFEIALPDDFQSVLDSLAG